MRQLRISKSITNRESASLDRYLYEISKYELLDVIGEVECAQRIRAGDKKALERMVKANLRFVVSVAKQYQNQGLSLPDLINEGNLGLIKAAERFDESRGFKFISYAVRWIRQSILQALAEQSRIVRLPLNKVSSLNKVNKTFSRLTNEYEREPSPEEVAEAMETTAHEINDILRGGLRHSSLDMPVSEYDNDTTLIDNIPNHAVEATDYMVDFRESLQKELERALNTLTSREQQIIVHYFGLQGNNPLNLEEIGERLELTRERVRQIKEKAIRRLRHTSRSKLLKQYLS